jgi:hypothetical protein
MKSCCKARELGCAAYSEVLSKGNTLINEQIIAFPSACGLLWWKDLAFDRTVTCTTAKSAK